MEQDIASSAPTDAAGFLSQVAVLILTYNEETNIGRTLAALERFPEVVVLDSGSTDETIAIASRFPNVRIVTRAFDQHATQWNYGLTSCSIRRPWVLALDADYVLPAGMVDDIANLPNESAVAGYRAAFRYCISGRPLSGALYPPHVVLYRADRARYVQGGHTQRIIVDGDVADLKGRIDHDDRKPLARWLQSQQRYAKLEVDYLLSTPIAELRSIDRFRLRGWLMPLAVPVYTLIVKRCVLDGWPGWYYTLQRMIAETMIALEIVERRRLKPPGH